MFVGDGFGTDMAYAAVKWKASVSIAGWPPAGAGALASIAAILHLAHPDRVLNALTTRDMPVVGKSLAPRCLAQRRRNVPRSGHKAMALYRLRVRRVTGGGGRMTSTPRASDGGSHR